MHTAALQPAPLRFMPTATLARTASTAPLKTQCSTCHLKDLCLPCGLTGTDVQRLDGLKFARRRIKEGETLCIIEAMKLLNEIDADATGVVTKILVENGQPVEFGQPLFVIG